MRSGFVLRPLPSHNAISVQDFLPTLVKREDARSGFTTSTLNPCLKSKHTSRSHPDCLPERSEGSQTQEEKRAFLQYVKNSYSAVALRSLDRFGKIAKG